MSVASEEGSFWNRACELVVMRSCVPTSYCVVSASPLAWSHVVQPVRRWRPPKTPRATTYSSLEATSNTMAWSLRISALIKGEGFDLKGSK
jgi:hypothetical protein